MFVAFIINRDVDYAQDPHGLILLELRTEVESQVSYSNQQW